ncbi:hypothetical protein ADP71_18610 [Vitreoscilla sp. C1]|uniref:YwqG family protein n=1 Tax=Vitreoscilla sp. (strain C1) TaxID=96942 RepID=UPI000CDBAF27|nr:DUF1963 domain-containing protein [Vitreoscilla sp. C1]AUZ05371.1 hypothetical protein ADP71_18610 [Vitreoscilla sp. C1]
MPADSRFKLASLQAYQDKILATARPSMQMILNPSSKLSLWQSKIGGTHYYLPVNTPHPQNTHGQAMFMLAQINCAELPPHDNLPKEGILQFYIDADDDLLGLDFHNRLAQVGFKILFHSHITTDTTQLQTITTPQWEYTPIDQEYAISFHPETQYISVEDADFGQAILDIPRHDSHEDISEHIPEGNTLLQDYAEAFPAIGHRLGGYPFFTQSDPRDDDEALADYILLLQIDSEGDIMWGDSGVCNFFIHPDDLKNQDFSKVLYNWDCY